MQKGSARFDMVVGHLHHPQGFQHLPQMLGQRRALQSGRPHLPKTGVSQLMQLVWTTPQYLCSPKFFTFDETSGWRSSLFWAYHLGTTIAASCSPVLLLWERMAAQLHHDTPIRMTFFFFLTPMVLWSSALTESRLSLATGVGNCRDRTRERLDWTAVFVDSPFSTSTLYTLRCHELHSHGIMHTRSPPLDLARVQQMDFQHVDILERFSEVCKTFDITFV